MAGEFVLDADSNSWGSDFDQGDDYGSDYSENEFQPSSGNSHVGPGGHLSMGHAGHSGGSRGSVTVPKTKNNVNQRKMVNRGRWTKDEVDIHASINFKLLINSLGFYHWLYYNIYCLFIYYNIFILRSLVTSSFLELTRSLIYSYLIFNVNVK